MPQSTIQRRSSDRYARSVAIIVGINKYPALKPDLKGSVADAEAVERNLNRFGFDEKIVLTEDKATKDGILTACQEFQKTSERDDRLFFFFAGHGELRDNGDERVGYLIPFDGQFDAPETWLPWSQLVGIAKGTKAKHVFFVADACHSGMVFTESSGADRTVQFLKDAIRDYARQALSSGRVRDKVDDASDPVTGGSIFAVHFLKGLRGEAGEGRSAITASGLGAYLEDKVVGYPQRPQFGQLAGRGDFIFNWADARDSLSVDAGKEAEVLPLWEGNVADKFLLDQTYLDIFLKDGFEFFKGRETVLLRRLSDPTKFTRILIVHPDFIHIEAVGSMDPRKRQIQGQQRRDCIASIVKLQEIAELLKLPSYDPTTNHHFRGCHIIPTWNGFIGDDLGNMRMYFSTPYRGPLNAISFRRKTDTFYESIKDDFNSAFDTETGGASDLWAYRVSPSDF